jgi:hypothetical protein
VSHCNPTSERPKWMGLKVPGDTMVFWWPAGTDPDTYDADHGRAMDMGVARYAELYGEAPEAACAAHLLLEILSIFTALKPGPWVHHI